MTVAEMVYMAGITKAKIHGKAQLRKCGKGGGPARLGRRAVSRLMRMLADGKSQAECDRVFGVSVRTIGRAVFPRFVLSCEELREARLGARLRFQMEGPIRQENWARIAFKRCRGARNKCLISCILFSFLGKTESVCN